MLPASQIALCALSAGIVFYEGRALGYALAFECYLLFSGDSSL